MITFTVIDRNGTSKPLEIPEGISLSLMEVLKASEYEIPAICGGMALCATCHIKVLQTDAALPEPAMNELEMLDSLPDAEENSRLSCQIRVNEQLNNAIIQLADLH